MDNKEIQERFKICNELALDLQAILKYDFISVYPLKNDVHGFAIVFTYNPSISLMEAKFKCYNTMSILNFFIADNRLTLLKDSTERTLKTIIKDPKAFVGLLRIWLSNGSTEQCQTIQ